MKIEALKKKRDALDRQIQEHRRLEKRGAEVAAIATRAEILELPDQVLFQAFKEIASVVRRAPAENSGGSEISNGAK